jgi:hypothetical protein
LREIVAGGPPRRGMRDAAVMRMPSSAEILAGLTTIANDARVVAIAWHVVLAAVVTAVAIGWRPSHRFGRAVIALPLFSVAAFAFAAGNPFTGAVATGGGTVLFLLAGIRGDDAPITGAGPVMRTVGAAAIAFGWVYPHFLAGPPLAYLYAAPFGLVPCPTLAVAIGFALLAGAPNDRAWNLVLAALGLFYAAFGIARLGVWLDLGLAIPAVTLALAHRSPRTTSTPTRPTSSPITA